MLPNCYLPEICPFTFYQRRIQDFFEGGGKGENQPEKLSENQKTMEQDDDTKASVFNGVAKKTV